MVCARSPRHRLSGVLSVAIGLIVALGCRDSGGLKRSTEAPSDAPRILETALVDENGNGVDEGDKVLVRFNRKVFTHGQDVTAILPDSLQDSLGTDPRLEQSVPGSEWVEITLGENPVLVPGPTGVTGVTLLDVQNGTGLPSSVEGINGHLAAPRRKGPVVLQDRTADAPTLVSVCYVDADNDDTVNEGDLVVAAFDKPVVVSAIAMVTDNFSLPVTGDDFGGGASMRATSTLATNRAVTIVLGSTPVLTVAKSFATGSVAATSPSGLTTLTALVDPITDTLTASPNTIAAGVTVDIDELEGGFFGPGREADAVLGNDAFTSARSAQVVGSPGGVDVFSGTLSVGGDDFTVSLLFVTDSDNDRVLIFENFPSGNFATASWVLGQPDFRTRTTADPTDTTLPAPSAAKLRRPCGVAFDGGTNRLYVSDTGNHRVLVWDLLFARTDGGQLVVENGRAATVVLGQESFTRNRANRGSVGPAASTLSSPGGLSIGGSQLAISDTGNSRVLIFGSLPHSGRALPATVLGQADFVSGDANRGGSTAADTLSAPAAVFLSDTESVNGSAGVVLVADTGNNRVLIYQSASPTSGGDADVVLGQSVFTDSGAGSADDELDGPAGVTLSSDVVAVADSGSHRIMTYDASGVLADGHSAEEVGQDPAPASSANRGGSPDADTLQAPSGLAALATGLTFTLIAADAGNNRVLAYEGLSLPIADPVATLALGQPTFTTATPGGQLFDQPTDMLLVGGKMVVTDTANHRVLIYDSIPTSPGDLPDVVLGQPDLFSTRSNQGGTPADTTLSLPTGLATDGTALAVADTGNHRVLIWSALPTVDEEPADVVLGQATFADSSPNADGPIGAGTFHSPEGIFVDDADRIAVADRDNNRALLFLGFSTLVDFADADAVVGQPNFGSGEPDRGEKESRGGLDHPRDVLIGGKDRHRFYVADTGNHRVLVWNSIPRRAGQEADGLLGQVSFDLAAGAGARADTLFAPTGLAIDSGASFLVIADTGHNRVLFFDDTRGMFAPRSTARLVVGQESFQDGRENRGNLGADPGSLSGPTGVFFNGHELFAADRGNNRIVTFR